MLLHIQLVLTLSVASAGCATEVDFRSRPKSPPVVINYNGVRAGARRFPDYSATDRRILAPTR